MYLAKIFYCYYLGMSIEISIIFLGSVVVSIYGTVAILYIRDYIQRNRVYHYQRLADEMV